MKCKVLLRLIVSVTFAVGTATQAITIDMVPVGDAGNAPDTCYEAPGYGSVSYVYKIGKYEVTNSQYQDFLNAVDPTGIDIYGLYNSNMKDSIYGGINFYSDAANGSKYYIKTGFDNKPVTFVSWYDAIRFVNWLQSGNTESGTYTITNGGANSGDVTLPDHSTFTSWHWILPSEDEWYKSAYYKGGGTNAGYWEYATQSEEPPIPEAPEGNDSERGSVNYANIIGEPINVGQYTFKPSISAYGTYDQNGNVWEWNETIMGPEGTLRGIRGGGWGSGSWTPTGTLEATDLSASFRYCSDTHGSHSHPYLEHADTGFRVAMVPEPATLLLLGLGGLAALRKRKI